LHNEAAHICYKRCHEIAEDQMKKAGIFMNGFEHYIIDDSPVDRSRVIFNMLQWHTLTCRKTLTNFNNITLHPVHLAIKQKAGLILDSFNNKIVNEFFFSLLLFIFDNE
jgi:hypothetical protein